MGTPEDVAAEKYFTPPTLTEMLKENMLDPYPIPDAVDKVKEIFKEWLRTVGLPDSRFWQAPESIRQLLITLVDEPYKEN